MSGPYEAIVMRDGDDWARNTVRLRLRERHGDRWAYLMPDGTWLSVEEGMSIAESGLLLPAGAVETIALAVQEFQGHTSHADTEARVLREWLAVEQRRVERMLEGAA